MRVELIRFAVGLDMGMRERGNKGDWSFWGPSSQRIELSSDRWGRLGVGKAGRGVGCSMLDLLDVKCLLDL